MNGQQFSQQQAKCWQKKHASYKIMRDESVVGNLRSNASASEYMLKSGGVDARKIDFFDDEREQMCLRRIPAQRLESDGLRWSRR